MMGGGPNKAFKALAMLAGTFNTPHQLGHGFAILPKPALRVERPLTRR